MKVGLEKWMGPYTVQIVHDESKIVVVQKNRDLPLERYNLAQFKLFHRPQVSSTLFTRSVHNTFSNYATSPSNTLEHDTPQRSSAVHGSRNFPFQTQVTEIVSNDDPRAQSSEMK